MERKSEATTGGASILRHLKFLSTVLFRTPANLLSNGGKSCHCRRVHTANANGRVSARGLSVCGGSVDTCAHMQMQMQRYALVHGVVCLRVRYRADDPPPCDTTFIATLYTSPSASARYADDPGAGLRELCVWRADLGRMGGFLEAAAMHPEGGFYTDFDLALELDSAEVRGVLLDGRGGEWGRVVFAFT
ncbi:hypothetical protein DFH06DRAFT_1327966 [Mycena polygramma]|nr:hypothetical protein DFH06DRAFT_1327966 [Mycena polygramma]